MKCLTVRFPYAQLIVSGLKTIETRSWSTDYRGELLIHTGRGHLFPPFEFLPMLEKVADSLMRARGVILGKATLMECRKLTPEDRSAALCNIDPSGYGWVLRDPVIFDEFVPRRGQQGLFEVEWPPPAEGKC